MNLKRYLSPAIAEASFKARKMAFISGPRQAGKTTMAKTMLTERKEGHYYNWDETTFRRLWTSDAKQIIPTTKTKKIPLIILDEIHKAKLWKRQIKGLYDTLRTPCDILVTGSAQLNVYRRGSDSLMGRYHHFRLHPLSLAELLHNKYSVLPDELWLAIKTGEHRTSKHARELLEQLITFGPFPEPFFAASKRSLNLWRAGRVEKIIREDLRDISRLPELSQIEMLVSLMPERAGNPLSITSLREVLEVAYTTVKRWLDYLSELYYHFELKPYSKSLSRGIKKEGKLYLWDWSEIDNEGARFENLIASHLLKYCHYLADIGEGKFELAYLRNKSMQEIDFIILKDNKPWLPIEAKLSDTEPSKNWKVFMPQLKCAQGIQVVLKPDVFHIVNEVGYEVIIISADQLLPYLI